jgi:hypothetical protein
LLSHSGEAEGAGAGGVAAEVLAVLLTAVGETIRPVG